MRRKLYTYIITADNGQSPCYDNGIFSLACCKPQIRRMILQEYKDGINTGKDEIWLCGIQRKKKKPSIVYLAHIDKVVRFEDYYGKSSHYYGRDDCYYHNIRTINSENTFGKLQRKLDIDTIRNELPSLYAERKNEHGGFKNYIKFNELPKVNRDAIIRDISGAAVLLSEHFVHCSYFNDCMELTKLLMPALEDVLNNYEIKNMRVFHQFDRWKDFDKAITDIPLELHKKVYPINKNDDICTDCQKAKKKRGIYGGC